MTEVHTAPGAYVNDRDDTIDTSGGDGATSACIVIQAKKGEVNRRILVRNGTDFVKKFGTADPTMGNKAYMSQLSALAAARGVTRLYVTRITNGGLYGGCTLLQEPTTHQVIFNSLQPFGLEDVTSPDFQLTDDVIMGIYSKAPGESDIKIKLEPNLTTIDGGFILSVYNPSSSLAPKKYNVSFLHRLNQMGEQMYVEEFINNRSPDILVRVNSRFSGTLSDSLISAPKTAFFAGGSNGVEVNNQQIIDGYELYRAADSAPIDLFINAGYDSVAVKQAITSIAKSSRATAINDIPLGIEHDSELVKNYRHNTLNIDSRSGMLVGPYLTCLDSSNNMTVYVPASGFVAAIMARSDAKTAKWFSPAGMQRGDVLLNQSQSSGQYLSVIGLRTTYDPTDQQVFAENQICPILNFTGYGIKLFGDYTLQSQKSMFQFINVSRMFDYVAREAKIRLFFSIFDPNDDILRQKVTTELKKITDPIVATRGLQKAPVISFTDTAETISRGEVHVQMGLLPIGSARVFELDLVLTNNDVSIAIL